MKKILAFGLVITMMLSLASCSGSNSNNNSNTTTNNSTSSTSSTTNESTAAESSSSATEETVAEEAVVEEVPVDPYPILSKFEPVDLGGRTIRIIQNWDDAYDSDMPEPDPDTATEDTYLQYDNIRRIEEKYNCKIDKVNVPFGEIQEQITTSVMAGAPVADMVDCDVSWLVPFVVNNLIYSFDEFMPENASLYTDKEYTKASPAINGKSYEFNIAGEDVQAYFLGLNMDLINASGAPNPVELYESGQWTWDKFLEVAKATTKDTTGDGITDQWGLAGWNCDIWKYLVASNSGIFYDDKTQTPLIDSPNVLEALSFFGQLYNDDKVVYVPGGTEIWDWDGNVNAFKEGKIAMFNCVYWLLPALPDKVPYQMSLVPYPKGPSSTDNVSWYSIPRGKVIPRGVEDPQYVYQIFEELEYWTVTAEDRIPNEGTYDYFRQRSIADEDTARLLKLNESDQHVLDLYILIGLDYGAFTGAVINGEMTPAQVIETNKQTIIDSMTEKLKPSAGE